MKTRVAPDRRGIEEQSNNVLYIQNRYYRSKVRLNPD